MKIRYIDLFCGIGGFRFGTEQALLSRGIQPECVFSSEIDLQAQLAYSANFGESPTGDITKVKAKDIPDHDLLLAGFPCQPFSIMGDSKGFEDTRGALFFEIAKILEVKRPEAFILENVKRLVSHDSGRTFKTILSTLEALGYQVSHQILNALKFGLPQKRERLILVGFREKTCFSWPRLDIPMTPLSEILETEIPPEHLVSDKIKARRPEHCTPISEPMIWHENKSGHISALHYSCALRAGASYNYLLVNGERRLTSRELLRLQGFPEEYKIVSTHWQVRKQAGNAVAVPVVRAVVFQVIEASGWEKIT